MNQIYYQFTKSIHQNMNSANLKILIGIFLFFFLTKFIQ